MFVDNVVRYAVLDNIVASTLRRTRQFVSDSNSRQLVIKTVSFIIANSATYKYAYEFQSTSQCSQTPPQSLFVHSLTTYTVLHRHSQNIDIYRVLANHYV